MKIRSIIATLVVVLASIPLVFAGQGDEGDGSRRGLVRETLAAGPYTYLKVETPEGTFWAAAPAFRVAVGNEVIVPKGVAMNGFKSESLGRTFEQIDFVGGVQVVGADDDLGSRDLPPGHPAAAALPAGHPEVGSAEGGEETVKPAAEIDFTGLKKPEGGKTVAEVFAAGAGSAGDEVLLRARVVKVSRGILGSNWLHVQDGTSHDGLDDLVVRTGDVAEVGDRVLVRGKVVLDRDLGHGYHYDLLLEEARIQVEPAS